MKLLNAVSSSVFASIPFLPQQAQIAPLVDRELPTIRVGAVDAERIAKSNQTGVPLPATHSSHFLASSRTDDSHRRFSHDHSSARSDERVNSRQHLSRAK
jgi:hypothetical protein